MTANRLTAEPISSFERNLTWWVIGCVVAGIVLGKLMPAVFQAISTIKLAEVNLPVAFLVWLMIIPMLLKIDFRAMGEVADHARGIGVTWQLTGWLSPFPWPY
jgi:arsenite transporter